MYKSQSITVIIPCLNEEQGIERVLRAMPEFVDEVIAPTSADSPPPLAILSSPSMATKATRWTRFPT